MGDFPTTSEPIEQRIEVLEKQARRLRRAVLALALVTIVTFAALGFGDLALRSLNVMTVRTLEVCDDNGKVHAVLTATTQHSRLAFVDPEDVPGYVFTQRQCPRSMAI